MLEFLKRLVFASLLVVGFGSMAFAVNPDEVLDDPALEQRARELSIEIRCLVCQNQSIDDSDAQLARDLRVLVREQLVAGKTNDEILDYLVERYGEFVLLKPRFTAQNLALWLLPLIALIGGLWMIVSMFRNRQKDEAPKLQHDLTSEEEAELKKILEK